MHAFAPTGRLASMADDTNYGSLGALAPNWDEGERNIDTDEIYERFFTWVEDVKGVEPWPHQEEAIMDLLAGDHVILNTPTGSGKSLVALGMHFAALCTGRRSYYTAPIKALVSEKFFDLVEVFGRENVGMITGDTHINADAPIICCTAEILANQALREGRHADVGCVAMDEFHYYGDPERGWAWQVPLLTLPDTQFLLMSATLGNVDAIADKLEDMTDTDVDIIADAPRPVPLTYEYALDPLEKTVELAFGKGETPIYVVHFSQDAALETANALASTGVSSKEQRAAIAEAIKGTKFTTAFGKILAASVAYRHRHPPCRHAPPLSSSGGAARPAGTAASDLRHRHAWCRYQCADSFRGIDRVDQVRRHEDAQAARPRVPSDRRTRRTHGLRHGGSGA